MSSRQITLNVLALLLIAQGVTAQQHPNRERGFAANKPFQFTDIDHVNLFNHNLVVTIPIGGTYSVDGGFSYGLTLTFSGNPWDIWQMNDFSGNTWPEAYPGRTANAGLGWSLSLGELRTELQASNTSPHEVYVTPDGVERVFGLWFNGQTPGGMYTSDGSYLRKTDKGNTQEIEFPDGRIHVLGSSDGKLQQIRDRFGNNVSITYPTSNQWKLTDSHGRVHYINFKAPANNNDYKWIVDTVDLSAFNGQRAVYRFGYEERLISRGCPHNTWGGVAVTVTVPLLKSVTVPDGSSFAIDYEIGNPSSDTCAYPSGLLKQMILPTLGKLRWEYAVYGFPDDSDLKKYFNFSAGVSRRILVDADDPDEQRARIWTYSSQFGPERVCGYIEPLRYMCSQTELQNTIKNPRGDQTLNYFSVYSGNHEAADNPKGYHLYEYGFNHTRRENDKTPDPNTRFLSSHVKHADGSLLRTRYARYEPGVSNDQNVRLKAERTVFDDDGGRYADVVYDDFDGLGHFRRTETGGNLGNDARISFTNYNPGGIPAATSPWLINLYDQQWQSQGGVTARTQSCFDTTTGVLKGRRTLRGDIADPKDLVVLLDRDGRGNITSEAWFGGDVAPAAPNDHCTFAPGAKYRIDHAYTYETFNGSAAVSRHSANYAGTSVVVTDDSFDLYTGFVKTSRDFASVATHYEYDILGRPTWVKPIGSAWTEYVYKRAGETAEYPRATALINRRPNSHPTGSPLTQSKVEFDWFGRVKTEHELLPQGWSHRETRYDAMGWKESVSEVASTPTNWTTFAYDPLGRVTRITAPDGTETVVHYTGAREVKRTRRVGTIFNVASPGVVEQTDTQTIETYDRHGRLVRVDEPGGISATNYEYDVGGRLGKVLMTSGVVTQMRLFGYDNRGLLLSEQHPENGTVEYRDYDAKGNAGFKSVNAQTHFDLKFTRDGAARLVKVESRNPYDLSAFRTLKEFIFASANDGANLRSGKLETALRHNYLPSVGDVIVTETYRYDDAAGRVTQRTTDLFLDGAMPTPLQRLVQKFNYDDLGAVVESEYPTCHDVPCGQPTWSKVKRTFASGHLKTVKSERLNADGTTTVFGFASDITYTPGGMMNTLTHGNGVIDTISPDVHGMPRPRAIEFGPWSGCTAATIALPPEDTTIQPGQTATLTVIASGTDPFSYQWYNQWSEPITGATGPTFTTPALTQTSKYSVRVSNACGHETSLQVTVTVNSCTAASITTHPQSTTIAAGQSVTVTVEASGSTPISYQWYEGTDTSTPIGTGTSFTTPALYSTTRYWARASNSCSSADSSTATITVPLPPPTGVRATKSSTSSIVIEWSRSDGAHHYELERRSGGEGFVRIQNLTSSPYTDSSLASNTTYAYRVRAVDADGGSASPYSNHDLATTNGAFSTIEAAVTPIRNSDIQDLLTLVNTVRAANGWAAVSWSAILPSGVPAPAVGVLIHAAHLSALRTRMDEAVQALGVATAAYTDPTLNSTIPVRAVHIQQLRDRSQ